MSLSKYLYFDKNEIINLFYITIVLSFLFSIFNYLYSNLDYSFFGVFIIFWIFIIFLLGTRFLFMKFIAYKNAFEIKLELTYFNRFWINRWDKVDDYNKTKLDFKGIPSYFISIFISILSLGFIIYPGIWKYKIKKIPHLHIGTQQKFEVQLGFMYNVDISDYRFSKVLFAGFLYYLFMGVIVKFLFENSQLYFWFMFIVFWIGFASLLPIFGSEGYELFRRNNFAWICILTILILGFFSLLIFTNSIYSIISTVILFFIILIYYLWKRLM